MGISLTTRGSLCSIQPSVIISAICASEPPKNFICTPMQEISLRCMTSAKVPTIIAMGAAKLFAARSSLEVRMASAARDHVNSVLDLFDAIHLFLKNDGSVRFLEFGTVPDIFLNVSQYFQINYPAIYKEYQEANVGATGIFEAQPYVDAAVKDVYKGGTLEGYRSMCNLVKVIQIVLLMRLLRQGETNQLLVESIQIPNGNTSINAKFARHLGMKVSDLFAVADAVVDIHVLHQNYREALGTRTLYELAREELPTAITDIDIDRALYHMLYNFGRGTGSSRADYARIGWPPPSDVKAIVEQLRPGVYWKESSR